MMYLKVSLSDYLSLFNARTRSWMWSRPPSNAVLGAGAFATAIATLLSLSWPFGCGMASIPVELVLFVWLFALASSLVQDVAKVASYSLLQSFGRMMDPVSAKSDDLVAYLENVHPAQSESILDCKAAPFVAHQATDKGPAGEDTPLLFKAAGGRGNDTVEV